MPRSTAGQGPDTAQVRSLVVPPSHQGALLHTCVCTNIVLGCTTAASDTVLPAQASADGLLVLVQAPLGSAAQLLRLAGPAGVPSQLRSWQQQAPSPGWASGLLRTVDLVLTAFLLLVCDEVGLAAGVTCILASSR